MMASVALYTPEVLALATALSEFPWSGDYDFEGTGRSKSCGSTIELGLVIDDGGHIEAVGTRSHACAVGQAAAAIFAKGAKGKSVAEITCAASDIERWLSQGGDVPDWPGLEVIAAARDYPARHGAILLAWNAARDVLPSTS